MAFRRIVSILFICIVFLQPLLQSLIVYIAGGNRITGSSRTELEISTSLLRRQIYTVDQPLKIAGDPVFMIPEFTFPLKFIPV
jgi:hypothetical protein